MKVRPASPAHQAKHGYDYMIAMDRTEWIALKVAVEICMEDLQAADRAGKLNTENQRGLLALYTVMHTTMEDNTRVCPDLPIQDQAVPAPEGRSPVRVQPIQRRSWYGIPLRSKNRQD